MDESLAQWAEFFGQEMGHLRTEIGHLRNEVAAQGKECREHDERAYHRLTDLKVELGKLQVKSSVWGFMAGMIPALTLMMWTLYNKQ